LGHLLINTLIVGAVRNQTLQVNQRLDGIDALRGAAIVWMTLFHFSFDLNHFGFLRQDFHSDPFWTWQRTAIVSLFLFCAGLGQSVAVAQGQSWSRFWRRWSQVAACALLVTLGSLWMFPQSFIYFGVLHGMALMLVLLRLFAPWARRHLGLLLFIGALLIAAKFIAQKTMIPGAVTELLNQRGLNWLGLVSRNPITEDYVPLVPWLGVVLWGFAAGTWLERRHPEVLRIRVASAFTPLVFLGRWSLSYYMLHQPVLIACVTLASWMAG
jgi:uncharacterized membrane protein